MISFYLYIHETDSHAGINAVYNNHFDRAHDKIHFQTFKKYFSSAENG